MRLKIFPWIIGFLAVILFVSAFTLYFYFRNSVLEELELRLINGADDLVVEIAKNPALFEKQPENLDGLLVQFMGMNGRMLAQTPGLKKNALPFSKGEDELLKDIEFDDGTKLKTYQIMIDLEGRQLGYIVVGVPTSRIYANIRQLGVIISVVMFCALIILGFGINALASLDMVKEQKKFLGFASHELRIPLSVISGSAEVALRGEGSSEEYREALSNIKEESDWMSRMVSNLLLVFRGKSGIEKLNKNRFSLSELLVEEASFIKKRSPGKNITLDLPPEAEIVADADQIRKLVRNLLDNAAKNTAADGHIKIRLSLGVKQFILKVGDDGVGISRKQKSRIFDAFYRVERDKNEGAGLGLAIAKWVTAAHGGKIFVEGEEGKGAEFTVFLPVK